MCPAGRRPLHPGVVSRARPGHSLLREVLITNNVDSARGEEFSEVIEGPHQARYKDMRAHHQANWQGYGVQRHSYGGLQNPTPATSRSTQRDFSSKQGPAKLKPHSSPLRPHEFVAQRARGPHEYSPS